MITAQEKHRVDLSKLKMGDVFSEESHYIYIGKSPNPDHLVFRHLESQDTVNIGLTYVEKYLTVADQFDTEVTVGKEDKHWTAKQISEEFKTGALPREGDLKQKGIRTIWNEIHSSKVFTVCFNKQGKEMSKRSYEAARDLQVAAAVQAIEEAARAKKGVEKAAKEAIRQIQENPIQLYQPGAERVLRGYKVQFSSINGIYNVVDMDLPEGQNIRQVNVNNILWLIYDKVKYLVK